jgi:hypothetical protein
MEAVVNDVRPANSSPLEWWFHVGFKWQPKKPNVKTASHLTMSLRSKWPPWPNDFFESMGIVGKGISTLRPFLLPYVAFDLHPVPTKEPSFVFFSAQIPRDGRLVNVNPHSHKAIYNQSFLFAGTPEELGLEHLSKGYKDWEAIPLSKTAFTSLAEIKTYVLQRSTETANPTPSLICHHEGGQELVEHFLYDRKGSISCREWNFKRGDVVTGLFLHHTCDPKSLGMEAVRNPGYVPEIFNEHSMWDLRYFPTDGKDYHERLVYGRSPSLGAQYR